MRAESLGELVRRSADWRQGFAALPWRMPKFVLLDNRAMRDFR